MNFKPFKEIKNRWSDAAMLQNLPHAIKIYTGTQNEY